MRSPYFDGNNYSYWKARMIAHLSSLGVRVWRSVLYGYEVTTIEDATTKKLRTKLDSEWDTGDKESFGANFCALNTIYGALSIPEFSRI